MNPSHAPALLLALSLGAASAIAQDLPPQALSSTGDERIPIHTAEADSGFQYGLWGAGESYKASFHDGAVFVPYLGRDYQNAVSLRWRTEAAHVGERSLRSHSPQLTHSQFRAEYDHGDLLEVYDLRHDGLEQTFVLHQRPLVNGAPANGDLVIRGRIASTLRTVSRAAAHRAVDFVDAQGQPIVRYGAAVAIDARGQRTPMTTSVDGDHLELRLPASSLAEAQFPLVIDPLLANIYANSSGQAIGEIDVLHDDQANSGQIWLVAERWASATDGDLRMRRINNGGGGATIVFSDITNTWSSAEPSLGNHEYAQHTLLAFTRHFNTNKRLVRTHSHDRADFALSTTVNTVWTGDFNAWRPDVATDYTAGAPDTLLVVFQRETDLIFLNSSASDIYATLVDVTTGGAGVVFPIAESNGADHERPTVGKIRSGGAGSWTVAYQRIDTPVAGSTWNIEVLRVDRNAVVTAPFSIGNSNDHAMTPRIAGRNGSQMLVYVSSTIGAVGTKPSGAAGQAIFASRLEWNGTSFTQPGPTSTIELTGDARLLLTGIDLDRDTDSHYALTYRSTVSENVYLEMLGYRGFSLGESLVFDAVGNDTSHGGAVTYDEDNEQFLLGYAHNIPGLGLESIRAYVHPVAVAPTTSGGSCGSGQLSWLGSQLIGDGSVSVRMDNAPVGAISTVILATSTANLQLFGIAPIVDGCWLLVPNSGPDFLGLLDPQLGPVSTWTFPLPEQLQPFTLRVQGVHFDATNTQILTTSRLSVPLVK